MDPQAISILKLISATNRTFIIPVYQRNYSWDEENCDTLFDDILESLKNKKKHYFGNIVYYAITTDYSTGYSELALIDGQQRITTIMLLLAALRDTADDETIRGNIEATYLINSLGSNTNRVKLKQIEGDRDVYDAIINKTFDGSKDSKAGKNYLLFKDRIKKSGKTTDEILSAINNFQVVALDLKLKEQGNLAESPQIIFESINATGKQLSEADLIRNYLLLGIPENEQESYYSNYWLKIEENTDDANNTVMFINSYLKLKLSDKISKGEEYKIFKKRCSELFSESNNPFKTAMEELAQYSEYYQTIKNPDIIENTSPDSAECLRNLNEIGNEALIPVLMFLLEKVNNSSVPFGYEGFRNSIKYLEDWIFRARITKDIDAPDVIRIAYSLPKTIADEESNNFTDAIRFELSNNTSYDAWPSDEKFSEAFTHFDFYNTRFYKNYVQRKLEYYICKDRIVYTPESIEHILPETLNDHWKNVLGENYSQLHAEYLHTIGNLVPMNQSDNSINSNDPFEDKLPQFKDSSWKLTRDIGEKYQEWNIDTIKQRSKAMAGIATKIWSGPSERIRPIEARINEKKIRNMSNIPDGTILTFEKSTTHGNIDAKLLKTTDEKGRTRYTVLRGSVLANEYDNCPYLWRREGAEGCLIREGDRTIVVKDYLLPYKVSNGPSGAANFCKMGSENGWTALKIADTGETLEEAALRIIEQ